MPGPNAEIAARLDEVGQLLAEQRADQFRVRAYHSAAEIVRNLPASLAVIYRDHGLDGLEQIPGVGPVIGRAIRDLLNTGRLPMLQRLRGEADPVRLFATVPGIGPGLAERLHSELGLSTLEDLELAAHDGRLAGLRGFGPKRVTGIRGALAQRLGRPPRGQAAETRPPGVAELLEVDREYRDAAAAGSLPTIAPRRFNPGHRSWLPVLHTIRGPRHYTALFSNTAHAHRLGRTRDWVVIYSDGDRAEHQATVVTARVGELAGHRIVRGREPECLEYYRRPPARRPVAETAQQADVLAGSSGPA
jgi:DNA polymerase (family X)